MKKSVRQVLNRMQRLFSKPGTWTKGYYARDKHGSPVDSLGKEATSWCMLGAVEKCCKEYGVGAKEVVVALAAPLVTAGYFVPYPTLVGHNDRDIQDRRAALSWIKKALTFKGD